MEDFNQPKIDFKPKKNHKPCFQLNDYQSLMRKSRRTTTTLMMLVKKKSVLILQCIFKYVFQYEYLEVSYTYRSSN